MLFCYTTYLRLLSSAKLQLFTLLQGISLDSSFPFLDGEEGTNQNSSKFDTSKNTIASGEGDWLDATPFAVLWCRRWQTARILRDFVMSEGMTYCRARADENPPNPLLSMQRYPAFYESESGPNKNGIRIMVKFSLVSLIHNMKSTKMNHPPLAI